MTKSLNGNPVRATCHPDREHCAHGLCWSCYTVQRQRRQRAAMSDEERAEWRLKQRVYFREYRRKWRAKNREQERKVQRNIKRKAYKRDPVKHRQRAAADRYGLTVPEYLALIAAADGHCQACGDATDKLQVDHCHEKGHIRGVLCGLCNSALGYAKDDVQRLELLIAYLKRTAGLAD